jgi:hypothetical protein
MSQTYPLKTLIQFAGSASAAAGGIAKFGSLAASSIAYSTDPAVIQALTAWVQGWSNAVISGNNAPALEDMNAVLFVLSYMMSYQYQEGIREWDAGTTYNKGSIVKLPYASTTGARLWVSLVDSNLNNALPAAPASNGNWKYCGDLTFNPNLGGYRRPNLTYVSGTTASLETGLDGTSGEAAVLFPDLSLIKDSTSGHIVLNLAQVASLGASPQSGLDTGSVVNNTWYAVYAVKANSAANFVLVASTNMPVQANYATLNSNFGTNGWVYLGMIRYGDQSGVANAIVKFTQTNGVTITRNVNSPSGLGIFNGILLASSASASSLAWAYASGTTGATIPVHLLEGFAASGFSPGAVAGLSYFSSNARTFDMNIVYAAASAGVFGQRAPVQFLDGMQVSMPAAGPCGIFLVGWIDSLLASPMGLL